MTLTSLPSFNDLNNHAKTMQSIKMRDLFTQNPQRFAENSIEKEGFLFDFSRHKINNETLQLFEKLALEANFTQKINAMMSGEVVNNTENRAAFHVALRNFSNTQLTVNGKDMRPEIELERAKMLEFAESIRNGKLKGSTNKKFKNIINIGIGGSDLGSVFTTKALKPYKAKHLKSYFVSNVDPSHMAETLESCKPEETLFIIASKTFSTQETMLNAKTARAWLVKALGDAAVANHFCAVSTASKEVKVFGIDENKMFKFWDFVGGRYSIWSVIGLPLAISIGEENFLAFLKGANAIDNHFKSAPFKENIPMIMGLLSVYYRNCFNLPAHAILPYDERLSRFPAFLQQLSMESNGKSVTRNGEPVKAHTGNIIWGEAGTNGQHAFYQLLHQGTTLIPSDFFVAVNAHENNIEQQQALLANVLAQAESLMHGKTTTEVSQQMRDKGVSEAEITKLAPHRTFHGERPSSLFIYPKLTPEILGKLIALYEHKTFVEAAIWDINPFDQWGVELGKEVANKIMPILQQPLTPLHGLDSATAGVLTYIRTHQT